MKLIAIYQFINGKWIDIGCISEYGPTTYNAFDKIKEAVQLGSTKIVLDTDEDGIIIINLDHGPVKFRRRG